MDTMMALSFGQMISGHVQGPYGEPKFAPIMGYRSVGDERSLFFNFTRLNSARIYKFKLRSSPTWPYPIISTKLGSPYRP